MPVRFTFLIALLLVSLFAQFGRAEIVRVALFDAEFSQSGPGVLLAKLRTKDVPNLNAFVRIIQTNNPDVLIVEGLDYDEGREAAHQLRQILQDEGVSFPHLLTFRPNSGAPSRLDLNRDGRVRGEADAWGWGKFPGSDSVVLFSKWPIDEANAHDYSKVRWSEFAWAQLPTDQVGETYYPKGTLSVLPLFSRGHWDVPILVGEKKIRLLISHLTPPAFGGKAKVNLRRNADEIRFWIEYLEGSKFNDHLGRPSSLIGDFVLVGTLNSDPNDGDGKKSVIRRLLNHPKTQDPVPKSVGGELAGGNDAHSGDNSADTVAWKNRPDLGNLRLDYVLPSASLHVVGSGVFWPKLDNQDVNAFRHKLVWVDIEVK